MYFNSSKMFLKYVGSLCNRKTFGYLTATREIQNLQRAGNNDFSQIEINVPWGKIKGKLWGCSKKQPILALHGWMDNAGSFDLIAPLLKNYSVLAIDLPGHGFSSWLPRGILYSDQVNVLTMRLIVKYFGWDKVKLLGHSMGGILCFYYSSLYPEEVEFVISIDSLTYDPVNIVNHCKNQALAIDKLLIFENKFTNDPPSYTEDVAIKRWMTATYFSPPTVHATKILMNRGARQKDDGTYYYLRDYRLALNGFNQRYSSEDVKAIAHRITCPYLTFKATNTRFHVNEYWRRVTEIFSQNKNFQFIDIEGPHHVHMVKPEQVANEILLFLNKCDT